MKRLIIAIILFALVFALPSCSDKKQLEYSGKLGIYDATVTVDGDKMTLSFTVTEKSTAMTVENTVKIIGTVEEKDGNKYVVDFCDEKTVVKMQYKVTGDGAENYFKALTDFLMLVAKTDADKAFVTALGEGKEISIGVDSALYTSLDGMPKTVEIKLYDNDNTFKIFK